MSAAEGTSQTDTPDVVLATPHGPISLTGREVDAIAAIMQVFPDAKLEGVSRRHQDGAVPCRACGIDRRRGNR